MRPQTYLLDAVLFEKPSCGFWFVGSLLYDWNNVFNQTSALLYFLFDRLLLDQTRVDPVLCFLPSKRCIFLLFVQKWLAVKILRSVKMLTEFFSFRK
jgi:hypothetical protein